MQCLDLCSAFVIFLAGRDLYRATLLTLVLLFAVSSEDLHQFNGHLQQAMATDVLFELTAIVSADESWYKFWGCFYFSRFTVLENL